MDFKPFAPPPSLHDPLNTGLSTEKGTTAMELVEGINKYLGHLFSLKNGDAPPAPDHTDLEARVSELEEALTASQQRAEALQAEIDAAQLRISALEKAPRGGVSLLHAAGVLADGSTPPPAADAPADAPASALDAALKKAVAQ